MVVDGEALLEGLVGIDSCFSLSLSFLTFSAFVGVEVGCGEGPLLESTLSALGEAASEEEQEDPTMRHVETIGPCTRDYAISIFFICFGVVAAVVGVSSNLYVQLNGVLVSDSEDGSNEYGR